MITIYVCANNCLCAWERVRGISYFNYYKVELCSFSCSLIYTVPKQSNMIDDDICSLVLQMNFNFNSTNHCILLSENMND